MSKRVILLLLFLIGSFSLINAQVVINEFLSSNTSGITDEDNEFSDWIELYNLSDNEVNLAGYILMDKLVDTSGWTFPEVKIQPKSFLLLFASGKNRNNINGNLHTNFKISKEGESLYLFNQFSELIDSSVSKALNENYSFGRYEDGDLNWYYFEQPSPGSKNLNPISDLAHNIVSFSAGSGYYSQTFFLTLQKSSFYGGIYYTTDGSVPTIASTLYYGSFEITTTTVVRAAIFNDSTSSNPVTTKTFIFNTSNGLPVVSISSDPKNFFDYYEGILAFGPNAEAANPNFGANFWMDWEKPINFEYIDKNGTAQINQGAGIKVSGQWSRANAQKSVAIYARKNYGKGSFNYKLFNDRENQSFESITFRNSGNDWSYTMMRDGLVSEIAKDMDMERLAYQPSVVYLNGEYWGILNMREKTSEHYFKENLGVEEGNLNLIEYTPSNGILLVYGTSDDYQIMHNFVDSKSLLNANNYEQVSEMMDIGSFIDYELLEIFIDNRDWPGNNCKLWKTNNPLSKWRWMIYDTDFGFNLYASYGNTLDFATAPDGESWPNPPWATLFLRKLLANEAFKIQFVNRFSDCLNSNLLASSIDSKVDSIQNILEPEIQNHLNRWLFSYDTWKYHVGRIKYFTSHRKTDMRKFMRDFFDFKLDFVINLSVSDNFSGKIKINSIVPSNYPFKGNYFGEVPITLKAMPNPGYRFVRWEVGSNSTDQNIVVNLTANKTFRAVFEPVIDNNYRLVINEINYKSSNENDAGDWIEIFNNGDQTVDLTGWIIHDDDTSNQFIFPAGQLIYPKEYLVINENNSKFRSIYPGVTNRVGEFAFGLSSSGDIINLYDNESNLVDHVSYNASPPWPVEPSGTGATLELNAPSLNNELAGNWSAGKLGGTPGSRNSVMVSASFYTDVATQASCFPTCFSDYTTLRFSSPAGSSFLIQILDMQGKIIETLTGICKSDGTNYLDLFSEPDHFIAGIYFVKVQTKTGVQSVKVIKR